LFSFAALRVLFESKANLNRLICVDVEKIKFLCINSKELKGFGRSMQERMALSLAKSICCFELLFDVGLS
jgi:hypothetical protein